MGKTKNRKNPPDPEAELLAAFKAMLDEGTAGGGPWPVVSRKNIADILTAIRDRDFRLAATLTARLSRQIHILSTVFKEVGNCKERDQLTRNVPRLKKAREVKDPKTKKRHQEIIAAVRLRWKENPYGSLDDACHFVARKHLKKNEKEFGWSYGAIHRITVGMKKPKRS